MTYTCPVCGYSELDEPPANFSICASCGTEFGYHDSRKSHAKLRAEWLYAGAKWFDTCLGMPEGWGPIAQLERAGLFEKNVRVVHEFTIGPVAGLVVHIASHAVVPARDVIERWDVRNAKSTGTTY